MKKNNEDSKELSVGLNTVKVCMGVKPKEKVLIITDSGALEPANIIYKTSKKITNEAIAKYVDTDIFLYTCSLKLYVRPQSIDALSAKINHI